MDVLKTVSWFELALLLARTMYFYLPAVAANMAPVVAAKLVPGNWPIWESGLGRNKTWRGLFFGILAAGVVFAIQKDLALTRIGSALSVIPYRSESTVVMAFLFGGGALLGDALKSLIKRHIPEGKNWPRFRLVPVAERRYPDGAKWPVFDQIDFIIGSTVAVWSIHYPAPSWSMFLLALVLAAIITPTLNKVFYWAGWKEKPH